MYVPALRGCVSEGDSRAEALENIKDAILTWLDSWERVEAQQRLKTAAHRPAATKSAGSGLQ